LNKDIAVKVSNLSKKYSIGKQKDGSLRGSLGNLFSSKSPSFQDFWALKDVSFDIQKGDVVGIIGKNGAGKSTLLKILSQITKPSKGRIETNGRIASLLEVGTGFHPELTGRENIYLNGTILGMTRKEVKAKFDEIVEFSGVEKFIDTPVKHYSSGMYVRLAFAVAAHLEPEILIIDEVLAVGDAEFQKKCLGKMQDVANHGRTVLFVSHNMASVKALCNKGILLVAGQKVFEGTAIETIEKYNSSNLGNQILYYTNNYKERIRGVKHIYVREVEFDNATYYPHSAMEIKIRLQKNEEAPAIKRIHLSIFIFDNLQNAVYQLSTKFIEEEFLFDPENDYCFSVNTLNLSPGNYSVGVWLGGNGFEQDYVENKISFEVLEGSIYPVINHDIISIIQKDFQVKINKNS
jgi:lipopolysaccharide transport system ATP-binding protein